MNLFKKPAVFLIIGITFLSCTKKEAAFSDPLITNRDTTISPATDFFNYANNGWFKKHPIANTDSSNGIMRNVVDTINAQIKSICEKAAKDESAVKGSNKQKIGDFYASGMDTVAIEKAGLSPLNSEIQKINEITNVDGIVNTIAHLHTVGLTPVFSFDVYQDDKISTKYALYFSQDGLGMGQRDFYLESDKRNTEIRTAYTSHLKTMMRFMGEDESVAGKSAATVLKLETELAKSSRKLELLRDPAKNYNKLTVDQFNALTPNIDWKKVLPILGIAKADTVIVGQPEFFKAFNSTLKNYTIEEWKTYLKWNLINSYAPYLNAAIEKENFKFYSTVMIGVSTQKPRWKRVVGKTDQYLGELVGQVYVTDYMPKGVKEKLLEVGNNIRDVFASHIKKLDWMSEATKQKALHKLSKIVMKLGYPDKWKDMSSLVIDRKSYCRNVMQTKIWEYKYMINKFGKPVDRNEWIMQPQTYNAYYNPSNNEIVIPACNIIVPGYEGRLPDDAILYGVIGGSFFGHEITHGFDDQGSQYDEKGNLNNWWTAEDLKKFKAKTKLIVSQYNKFTILGKNVNGEATQGENIADLGGVVMGYEAFQKTEQYKKNEKISGLTPDQRYFLAYAYSWMVNRRDESKINLITTDVHSPEQFRVNGPVSNIPEFYKAFNVKEGDKMYQPDNLRVTIW
ncbi:endothelin-converting enzyme Metallo peptidase. MEROPS family M13 [Flavobacterium aquidurense]|uniref:Metalloendopeptidase n=1 Tax=Flavobacterium frigidimaris TaxID=262320 RepID=A0ABX4BPL8_FLAFR|nr:M13 family metallopeptidase [Flavobacterium frigidimaris]OXA78243.1 metalloendopeptidase [Flavobacterium frigidimaris]SDY28165.1 endothelin-converting enzyme Metallo peptidase. MEROPS family M13 [Flavobacterium aquidurense]